MNVHRQKFRLIAENIGIHGAGMNKFDLMRTMGMAGPALHREGPVEMDEVIKVARAINEAMADPDQDNIVAYSRGAAVLAEAFRMRMIKDVPRVTLLAPAIYRGWSTAPPPQLAPGSFVMIGEGDDKVSVKQACRVGIESGIPVYVVPGVSHTGILYTRAVPTEDSYKIDAAGYISDKLTPDWGRAPKASQQQMRDQVKMSKKYSFNKRESRASIVLRDLIRETVLLLELRNAPNSPVPSDSKYFARPIADGYVLYYTSGPTGPVAIPGTMSYYYDATYAAGAKPAIGKEFDLTPDQIQKAEELVSLGFFQKFEKFEKSPEIAFRYKSKDPAAASHHWKSIADVPTKYFSYGPSNLQGFEYLLVDTDNKLVSLDASWKGNQTRRGASRPGKQSDKSYVTPSGDVAFSSSGLDLQKLFKHLMRVDPRVTPDYQIVSPDDKYDGKTIGQAAEAPRTTDVALGNAPGKLFAYHGTSTKRWPVIEKRGMHPGKFEEAYADQIPGYSVKNLYFTFDPATAENYATRAAIWDTAGALILKVEIPDITRIIPDEDSINWFELDREYTLTQTDRRTVEWNWELAEPRVEGTKPGETVTIAQKQHIQNIMRTVRQANSSRAYGKTADEEPDAGPEYVDDAEYRALLADIERKMASHLTKSLAGETFAYRGWIPPKFVKKWKQYPRKAYPKAVDQGGGTGREYEETRQDVLKKVKRFDKNEAVLRSIIRRLI